MTPEQQQAAEWEAVERAAGRELIPGIGLAKRLEMVREIAELRALGVEVEEEGLLWRRPCCHICGHPDAAYGLCNHEGTPWE
jgi:hypothetical protein